MPVHAPALPAVIDRSYRYADYVPYYTPARLDDLCGPAVGSVIAPPNISTAPDPGYDLAVPGQVRALYSATVRDGNQEQQEALLNKDVLTRLWPELNLPARCRSIWETEFPQLRWAS